jgi:hypothetical protein
METRVNVSTTVRVGWSLPASAKKAVKTIEGLTLSELLYYALMGDGRAETMGA